MTTKNEQTRYGLAAIILGLASTVVYLIMINITLAHIEALSGLIPFDMRPFGYNPQEARQLLVGLGAEGRRYYLTRQIPLDMIYPALLAMTLTSTFLWVGTRFPSTKLVHLGTMLSIGAALFDYAENLGVALLIIHWPGVDDALIYTTSSATILKSSLTVAAVFVLLIFGAIWMVKTGNARHQSRLSSSAK